MTTSTRAVLRRTAQYISEAEHGNRAQIGPASATLAATQTNTVLALGAAAGGYLAQRGGSVVGFSAKVSAAITGAGTTVNARVEIDGTPVAATALIFTQAGEETELRATFVKGVHAFAAGEVVRVVYTSTGIANTPTIVAHVEIEQR